MSLHPHPQSKSVINRLARIAGHVEAIKRMAEEGRECSDLLVQISAVTSALNSVGKVVLEDHISQCLVDSGSPEQREVLNGLLDAIDKYLGTSSRRWENSH
ncbi:MAG: Copper-sensing transcriptional repressor CsoR [Firmicutes bacterium]|nr:Copper-sensing transcriptional repressor CsoR [candidate division NPL-UPA2 bacterium]